MFSPTNGDVLRYTCVPEADGTFTVWDTRELVVATLDSQPLDHRPQQRAAAACAILNRIETSNLALRRSSGSDMVLP